MAGYVLEQDLRDLLNRHCVENESDTPDHILAQYLMQCLEVWKDTVAARDEWYDFNPRDGRRR